jgi:hypothetical protein
VLPLLVAGAGAGVGVITGAEGEVEDEDAVKEVMGKIQTRDWTGGRTRLPGFFLAAYKAL